VGGDSVVRSGCESGFSSHNSETVIGTARSGVSFMNRFRKLGFIHYNDGLQVRSSLLNVALQLGVNTDQKEFRIQRRSS
jgi:hypothetical protein